MLGSIIPSSRFLVNAVLAPIDWSRARVIVEYGPGVGTFTAEILRRMRSDARLIVIETNLEFVQFMGESLPDSRLHRRARLRRERAGDPAPPRVAACRLHRVGYSARQHAEETAGAIAIASRDALETRGEFLVYQFTSRVLPVLRETFQGVRRSIEVRNFPPAQLFVCPAAGDVTN